MALTKPQLEAVYRELETPLYNFALRWVFDTDMSYEEVAKALGIAEGTVASRKSRALRILRNKMEKV